LRQTRHLVLLYIALSSVPILAQHYFPPHAFEDDDKLNSFIVRWYSDQVIALQEPSLWEASRSSKSSQIYRFLWLPTFNHPVAVRVELAEDGTGTIVAKMSSGSGGYKPGKLIENRTCAVSRDDIQKLLAKLDSTDYWSLRSRDPESRGEEGSEWTIESVRDGNYKLVNRWSPKDGPARDLGLMFLRLSGLKIAPDQIY
jgi:hypothetical protein